MLLLILDFWEITPCAGVGRYRGFEGTYRIHLQSLTFKKKAERLSATCLPAILQGHNTDDRGGGDILPKRPYPLYNNTSTNSTSTFETWKTIYNSFSFSVHMNNPIYAI